MSTKTGGSAQLRFELTGAWFDDQGQYRSRTESTPYYDNHFN
ncbi:hypothetical protein [Nonomuraea sp. NPDC050643]